MLASQNITNNHSSYTQTNMMYQIQDNHDLQIATTVSPLLSSNNITINADGSNGNINLLSAIITGQSNLNLNGNVNMQSLQDLYYQYDFSQATSMNLGALLGMLLAAVVIGAVTGGVGTAILGAAGMSAAVAQVGMMAAVMAAAGSAALGALAGVGIQMGISAAITAKDGGIGATADMQSGHMDSTTKQYQALVGNSLLFGGNVNTNSSNNSIDSAASISSSNLNQTADNQESALFKEEHRTIGPDWNQLMTDAGINGVVAGTTVVASDFLTWYTKFKPTWAVGDDATLKPANRLAATAEFKAEYFKKFGVEYKGVVDNAANNIGFANTTDDLVMVGKPVNLTGTDYWLSLKEGGLLSQTANLFPGINGMSLFHDTWATTVPLIESSKALTALTIIPSIPLTYLGLGGNYITGVTIGGVNGSK